MEQFIFVLVIAIVGLVKLLVEKSNERRMKRADEVIKELERNNPPLPPVTRPIHPIDPFPLPRPLQDAERRLREALGIPDDEALPPRRPMPAPLPMEEPARTAFRVEEVRSVPAADLERRIMTPPPILPRQMPRKPLAEAPAARRLSGLDELLRSRDGLRRAVVMQEILGTPKGLVF